MVNFTRDVFNANFFVALYVLLLAFEFVYFNVKTITLSSALDAELVAGLATCWHLCLYANNSVVFLEYLISNNPFLELTAMCYYCSGHQAMKMVSMLVFLL